MYNKFVAAVEDLFAKYGKDDDRYILLGCCKQGDEDGGMDTDDYFSAGAVLEQLENFKPEMHVLDPWPSEDQEDKEKFKAGKKRYEEFKKDFAALQALFMSSFPDFFKPDYEGTNCYWYRCYFVNRFYQMFQVCTSDWDPNDQEWEFNINLIKLTDDSVNEEADKQDIAEIETNIRNITNLLRNLRTEHGMATASGKLKDLYELTLKPETLKKK